MTKIIFPRKVSSVGACICLLSEGNCKGRLMKKRRKTIRYQDQLWVASRLSYSLNVHRIPRKIKTLKVGIVCHTCDHPWCINPKHLYLGTASQNKKDCWDRNFTFRKNAIKSYSAAGLKRFARSGEREKHSARLRKYFSSKSAREKVSVAMTEKWKDPSYRKMMMRRKRNGS